MNNSNVYGMEGSEPFDAEVVSETKIEATGVAVVPLTNYMVPIGDADSSNEEQVPLVDFGPNLQKLGCKHDAEQFTLHQEGKDKDRKIDVVKLTAPNNAPVTGLIIQLGSGEASGENAPFWRKAQIWLKDPQAQALTRVLQRAGVDIVISKGYIEAYGNCTGGVAPYGFPVSVYDAIVSALIQQQPSVTIFGRTVSLVNEPVCGLANWTTNPERPENSTPLVFTKKLLGARGPALAATRWYWELMDVKLVPFEAQLGDIPPGYASRVLQVTDFQGSAFNYFDSAMRLIVATNEGHDPLDFDSYKEKLKKVYQQIKIQVTTRQKRISGRPVQEHLRFWTPMKKDFGMSLYEAIHHPDFRKVVTRSATSRPYTQDEARLEWLGTCGEKVITKDRGVIKDVENSRFSG